MTLVERVVRNNHERRKLGNGEGLEQNSADSLTDQLHDGRGAEPVRGQNPDGTGNEAGRFSGRFKSVKSVLRGFGQSRSADSFNLPKFCPKA